MTPEVSIVIPAYNEGETIETVLDMIASSTRTDYEVLVVYDTANDTTAPAVTTYSHTDPRVVPTLNTYGRGPAQALRFGIDHASAEIVVVMMADGSDDPKQIDNMVRRIRAGNVVVAASRYMKGGRQIGGPLLKRTLSRVAGLSLYRLARVGTHDATNSFKAYSKPFLKDAGIDSRSGFEMGIELVAKARRLRRPVAEVPTTWSDRTSGESRFRVVGWLPDYLRWYLFSFGRPLSLSEVEARARAVAGGAKNG